MEPNDPTRVIPAASPPGQEPGWPPPPPVPAAWPAGRYTEPPTTVTYPTAAPAGPTSPPPMDTPYGGGGGGGGGRGKSQSKGLLATGAVLALVLAGVVGFIIGVQVEKGRSPSSTVAAGSGSTSTSPPTGQPGGGGIRGRAVGGRVTAMTPSGFTVTLADGSTATVAVTTRTRYVKTVKGSLQDVAQGERVTVTGARAADGSITATVVTITPARGAGLGGPGTSTTAPAG